MTDKPELLADIERQIEKLIAEAPDDGMKLCDWISARMKNAVTPALPEEREKLVNVDVAARQAMGLYYELAGIPNMAEDVRGDNWEEGCGEGERLLLRVLKTAILTARREVAAVSDALGRLIPPCELGCTAVACPYPQEKASLMDRPCCIGRRALSATVASLPDEEAVERDADVLGAQMVLEQRAQAATDCLAKPDWRPDRAHIEGMRNAMKEVLQYLKDARTIAAAALRASPNRTPKA